MISRENFCDLFYSIFDDEQTEHLFDVLESGKNKEEFILQYYNETVLIYDTLTDNFVSWYKLTHLGRAINTNITERDAMLSFLTSLYETITGGTK